MSLTPRLSAALLLAAALLALAAGPVAAKISYFSIEMSPPGPTGGEPVTVILRFWNDPAHTVPADWAPPEEFMDDIVAFVSDGGRVDVDLTPAADGTYRGSVTLPAGSWTLVPFPDSPLSEEVPGYPEPIPVLVADAPAPAAPAPAPAALPMVLVMIGAGVVLMIGLIVIRGQRGRSFPLAGMGTLATQRGIPTIEKPAK